MPPHYAAGLESPAKRRRLDGEPAPAPPPPLPVLNRTGAIDPGLHRELAGIVNHFRAPIRHAFAYGSAVFRQAGYSDAVCSGAGLRGSAVVRSAEPAAIRTSR